jgi:predicted DNA-binding protein (UPF0251 family)
MAQDEAFPMDKLDVPLEMMQRVGLLDDPEVTPYFQREDVDLTTAEKITLLSGAGLLTERQAAAYVHRRLENHSRMKSAEEMDIAASTLDDYLRNAEDKIAMADLTGRVIDLLEADTR